jgi:hypothetical protein
MIQIIPPSIEAGEIVSDRAVLVASSVQDVVNLRAAGIKNPSVALPFVKRLSPKVDAEPLLVARHDMTDSSEVWSALARSIPVLYPVDSAYGEQVFHAGLPYDDSLEIAGDFALLSQDRDKLGDVVWLPSPKASLGALLRLALLLRKLA